MEQETHKQTIEQKTDVARQVRRRSLLGDELHSVHCHERGCTGWWLRLRVARTVLRAVIRANIPSWQGCRIHKLGGVLPQLHPSTRIWTEESFRSVLDLLRFDLLSVYRNRHHL